jgi:hypothetical protein
MSLTNSGDQSDEQREHLLDAQFRRMANELERELSGIKIDGELLANQIDASGWAVQEILWTVRFVHRIFARSRTIRFYLRRQISESELLRMATRGYPLKLRQAEAELKNIRDQIPESPTLIQEMKWSGFRWADVVMEMGFEHHRIFERHGDRQIHQWWPFIEEVAGRGDGSSAKWNYDIQEENIGQLRQSLACLPSCKWIPADETRLPEESKSEETEPEGLWITFIEAERTTDINRGTIQRAADDGEIVDNGLRLRGRRIDLASFWRWHDDYRKRTTKSNS